MATCSAGVRAGCQPVPAPERALQLWTSTANLACPQVAAWHAGSPSSLPLGQRPCSPRPLSCVRSPRAPTSPARRLSRPAFWCALMRRQRLQLHAGHRLHRQPGAPGSHRVAARPAGGAAAGMLGDKHCQYRFASPSEASAGPHPSVLGRGQVPHSCPPGRDLLLVNQPHMAPSLRDAERPALAPPAPRAGGGHQCSQVPLGGHHSRRAAADLGLGARRAPG